MEERLPLLRMLTLADWFTLLNAFLGFSAIAVSMHGEFRFAFMLILVGVLIDGVDGGLARIGYGGGRLGGKLDTLADLVTFCVAPAFLFWNAYAGRVVEPNPFPAYLDAVWITGGLVLAAGVFYFLTGLLRLARFDYLQGGRRHDYFLGVSTPGGAVVVASLALLGWDLLPSLALVVFVSFLMISRVRLPKIRGALQAPAVLILAFALVIDSVAPNVGPVTLLVCFLFYLLLGPGYVRRRLEEEEPAVTW